MGEADVDCVGSLLHVPHRYAEHSGERDREAALQRIELALPLDESALTTMQSAKAAPKVAFGTLVETGWVAPGTVLTDKKRRLKATVRADGSLTAGEASGSIHGLGAQLQGAPSCNGWTFWHVAGEPIDAVRQQYISSLRA